MTARSNGAMTLDELLAATGGALVHRPPEKRPIEGISIDSRNVPKGAVFIGVPGERFDGSDFAAAAVQQGAHAVVVPWEKAKTVAAEVRSVAVIAVDSTIRTLGLLARGYRRRSQARVIGVTGSNGKTTTKEMIAAALRETGPTLATEGNLNNEIGVPLTLFQLKPQHQYAVIEMGMNHEGEIGRLTSIAEPHVGVVTMAAAVHLEGLGTLENVSRAKGELYTGLPIDGVAVANADDPMMRDRAKWAGRRTTWFGTAQGADVRLARIVKHDRTGLTCVVHVFGEERTLQLPVVGEHNAMNACAAIAASLAAGATLESVWRGVSSARPPGRRLLLTPIPGIDATLLDDTYNANPSSAIAALKTLVELAPEGHRIAIVGDMRELGIGEVAGHREVGAAAAGSGLKLLVAFGPVSKHVATAAVAAGMPEAKVLHTEDPASAAERVRAVLQANDLVLAKASRGTRLERVSDLLAPKAQPEAH
jgi:UDP-N-acetylmuramoyl-tripeptide--D-alanyl-D-alanine ligase